MSAGIRSDSEKAIREWLARLGVTTLYIEPGSPWDNGYVESLIGKFRKMSCSMVRIFYTLTEARSDRRRAWKDRGADIRGGSRRRHQGRAMATRPSAAWTVWPAR